MKYARTNDGIMKMVICEDNRFFNEYGNGYFYNEMLCSPGDRIIEIVRVGDFINGKEVKEIIHYAGDEFYRLELFGGKAIMNDKDIESVLTKEQFDDNCFHNS